MTATTPATVDDTTYDVTRAVLIRADRDRVWAAITVPELISEWLGDEATFEALEVGARGTFTWHDHGTMPVEIVEYDEPSVFAFRWGEPGATVMTQTTSTVARYTLEVVPEGTLLTVVETGFANLSDGRTRADGNRKGWDSELDELVAFLEKQDSA